MLFNLIFFVSDINFASSNLVYDLYCVHKHLSRHSGANTSMLKGFMKCDYNVSRRLNQCFITKI